jgi:predicted sulfurtransferase
MTSPILNIAAYKFTTLDNLPALRIHLRELCTSENLKGTIILSPEGINLVLAGPHPAIERFLTHLRALPNLADLQLKESTSDTQPFGRLRIKLKNEIIPFNIPTIDPRKYTSRRVSPQLLKQWLDERRPLTLLDTRNTFEIDVGTFENALPIHIDDFREFPDAAQKLPDSLKHQPVVTFCTGGIRCEKAAPYLEQLGFTDVYQLDGGILKYLESCGHAHFTGDCFVFDQRLALTDTLTPSENPPNIKC